MYKLNETQLEAIHSMRGNVNWKIFIDMLREQRDSRGYDTNVLTDQNRIYVSQGRFRELHDLVDVIDNAEKKLEYARGK